jgi:putative FmdB family regulatory protein
MPIYEYACHKEKKFVEIMTRRIPEEGWAPACPDCGSKRLTRMISRFQFHQSFISKMDALDPKYDKMIDAASPDLSFDNLVKQYGLDRPMSTAKERKQFKESGSKGLIP